MTPLVSILIPCFNAERWIAEAIESALAQTWSRKEIIVIDDGSTDGSLDIIKRFDGRIRWETGANRGSNAARNRLLVLARGDWLQYLDADDYLLPEKVTRQIEFAREHPNADIIYSPVAWKRTTNGADACTETSIPEPRDPWILLALWHLPQTGGALWKKRAVVSVGGWRVGQPCCQEHELYCRLLEANAQFAYCAGCLAVYRDLEQDGRITRKPRGELVRERLAILDRIERHLQQCGQLTSLRRQAVNDGRHELARSLWLNHRQQAMDTNKRIRSSDASFLPSATCNPILYLAAYRVLGFQAAQIVAYCKRALLRRQSIIN